MRRLLKLEKITEATVEILDRFRHPGFSAFQGPAIQPDDTGAREKLAVYILRPPVALGRIDYQQAGGVIFHPSRPVAVARNTIPPPQLNPRGLLRTRIRRKMVLAFMKHWHRKIRWRSAMMSPSEILEQQAVSLVKLIQHDGAYHPFRMRW